MGTPRSSFSRGAGTERQSSLSNLFYQFVQNAAGVLLPQRLITQFTGAAVTVSDDAANNRTIVDLSGVSAAEMFIFGASRTLTVAADRWLFPGYAQADPRNDDTVRVIAPRAGTLRNLFIEHNVVGGNDPKTLTYTVQLNGIDTLLAVTLLATAASGSNLVNTVAVAQGDELGLRMSKSAVLNSAPQRVVTSMEFA